MTDIDGDAIVKAARKAAEDAGHPVSRADFVRMTGIGEWHIYRAFPEGGWSEVKRRAGLEPHPKHMSALSDEDMLTEWHRVAIECGGIPTWAVFRSRASISDDSVRKRFGGMKKTLMRYLEWLRENEPASSLIEAVHRRLSPLPEPQVDASATTATDHPANDGPTFGAPLDFRGLRHAPINETGVVFLFGMVALELGFHVEAVHAAYPDCEAKRCVDAKRERWQRVRIEFEFRSRNFRDHGHDPSRCDLIVCWEHNWPECPVDVVELRSVIEDLEP